MTAQNVIVTCMKNEGPFILEWIAHHLDIGFDHFVVYTNDCDDGTEEILDALMAAGYVTRLDNPFRETGEAKPQRAALKHASTLDVVRDAQWVLVSDVDEFVNIHVGEGRLRDLIDAAGQPDAISMQWRLFGSSDLEDFEDLPIISRHTLCAPRLCPRPIQAWGVKTLFRPAAFKELGVHRPLAPAQSKLKWTNGSGKAVSKKFHESGWRFGVGGYGYDLVTLNHYSTRNAASYLVKKDRGRVNHVNREQGDSYWLRMNINMEHDASLYGRLPQIINRIGELRSLPGVAACHDDAVRLHVDKIKALKARDDTKALFDEITSERAKTVSRHINMIPREHFDSGLLGIPSDLVSMLEKVPHIG